jgi:glutathione synthase
MPPTFIGSTYRKIMEFLSQHGKIVAKPLYHCSGKGIEKIDFDNGEKIIKQMLIDYPEGLICQKYISEVETTGDVRVLIINGKIIASMKRIPQEGNFRCNLACGATCHQYTLTDEEKNAMEEIGSFLAKNGIYFSAVDMIGGKLCEINITSPGLVHEMNSVDNQKYQKIMQDNFEEMYLNLNE